MKRIAEKERCRHEQFASVSVDCGGGAFPSGDEVLYEKGQDKGGIVCDMVYECCFCSVRNGVELSLVPVSVLSVSDCAQCGMGACLSVDNNTVHLGDAHGIFVDEKEKEVQ